MRNIIQATRYKKNDIKSGLISGRLFLVAQIILVSCLLFLVAFPVKSATLFLLPQSSDIFKGESFITELMIDTEEENINAADIKIIFPSNLIKVNDFEKGGSIFTLWAKEPEIQEGEISFSAGVPGGFSGKGLIGRINFSAKEIGEFEINFKEDSKVLLNDGIGTPTELGFAEGNYKIVEKSGDLAIITSKSHPDPNKWYSQKNLNLWWDLAKGAEYSYLLSFNPSDSPDEIPDKPEGELEWMGAIEYKGLDEGIYYFSLKQKLFGKDWSGKVTFRAMIDTTKPEEFKPEIAEIEGKKYLVFSTIDKTSGVDYYEVLETRNKKQETWKIAKSPYILSDQGLESKISVKAVDKAGNERISEIALSIKPFPYWVIIPILIGLIVIWWIIRRLKLKRNK